MEVSSGTNLIKRKAFTLIELLVVISIIGVLAALTAGAVFKYAAWQRDPTNPNSSVSITINTVKQAVARITQDIQQKAKQDFQALSPTDKSYYQTLADKLKTNGLLTELDPNARAIQVYTNAQIVRNFPISVLAIPPIPLTPPPPPPPPSPIYLFQQNPTSAPNAPVFEVNFNPGVLNATYVFPAPCPLSSITSNTIRRNIPPKASTNNRDSSACLLVSLESHPKGLKVEDLGSGSVVTDTTGARIIKPGGVVVYHKIHYVDINDYNADKSLKVGSLRVDIVYDTE